MHSAKNIKLLVIQPVANDYLLPFLCRIKCDLLRKPINFISLKGTSKLEVTVKNMSIATPCCLQGAIFFRTTINGKTATHKVKTL
jgi:hypothetical protein